MTDETPGAGVSHVRGEMPTCAGPVTVQKLLTALRRVTGRGARTRAVLRGAVTGWSVSGEPVRFRMVASQRGAPVPLQRVAREFGDRRPLLSPSGWSWIGPADAGRADRSRQTRWQPAMTTGTLTPSKAGCSAEVTSRYKRCEIRLECGGEAGDLSRLFGGLSIFPVKASPKRLDPRSGRAAAGERPRGVTAAEGRRGVAGRTRETLV